MIFKDFIICLIIGISLILLINHIKNLGLDTIQVLKKDNITQVIINILLIFSSQIYIIFCSFFIISKIKEIKGDEK